MTPTSRAYGFTAAVLGVLGVAPDAALLRVEKEAGGSTSVIGVWRYVMLTLVNLCLGAIFEGGLHKLARGVRRSWLPVLGASTIIIFINAGFTISLLYVDPALALLLISMNPLWAALLGKVLLGDPLPLRTVIAQICSLCATVLVFMPNLIAYFQAAVDAVDDDLSSSNSSSSGGSGGSSGSSGRRVS